MNRNENLPMIQALNQEPLSHHSTHILYDTFQLTTQLSFYKYLLFLNYKKRVQSDKHKTCLDKHYKSSLETFYSTKIRIQLLL